jgi:hypothetical protein
MQETNLTKEEFELFLKGIKWFGLRKRWNAISRYFLPERTPEYLEKYLKINYLDYTMS